MKKRVSTTFYLRSPRERQGNAAVSGRLQGVVSEVRRTRAFPGHPAGNSPLERTPLKGSVVEGLVAEGADRLAELTREGGHPPRD